jgi:hypothetical protein
LIYHPNSTLTSTRPTDATPPRKPLPPSPLPPSEAVDDVENEEQKDEDEDEQQQQRQKATPPVEVDRSCANCGAAEESANSGATTHRPCSRCKAAYYCSVKCQKEHWKAHKLTCVAPSATPMASAASAALAAAAAGRGRGDGTSGVARGGGGGGGGADTVVEGGGCGGYLYIYGGETYPGEADGVNPLDGLRGAGTTFDFFRLRLSSDMTEGVWEKRLVVGDHPGPLQEVHPGVLLNDSKPYSRSSSSGGSSGSSGGGGDVDEDEFGHAREQKILLFGGYRCWGRPREALHKGELANSNTATEPGPYLRDLYVYEHGVFRRLELLRDGGVAKSAQNHVLPVTDRAFHSVRTRDVRRCPEARCFVLVDGYGTTATTGFSESSKEAATAFRADRRLRGVPNAYNESMSGSIFPEKLHSFLHCTLHDSEVAAAAGVAGSESVFLATVPMMTAGHQTDKGGVFADTFVQGMMNQRSTTKFMMTAVETKMPHDGDVREKREEMLPELEAKMKQAELEAGLWNAEECEKQAAEFAATQSQRQKDLAQRAKKAKVREEAAEGSSYVPRDGGIAVCWLVVAAAAAEECRDPSKNLNINMDTYRGPLCVDLKRDLAAADPEWHKKLLFQPRGRGPLFEPSPPPPAAMVSENKTGSVLEAHQARHAAVNAPAAAAYAARLSSDPALRPDPLRAATMTVTVALLGVLPLVWRYGS